MPFCDVDTSGEVEVILCEVDEPSTDSVVSVLCDVNAFSEEVGVTSDDCVVIFDKAPSNWQCSISSGSYCNTHCMPSGKSVKVHSSAKQKEKYVI